MLDLFCTGNGNNDGKFSNADFDAAMEKAASTMDTAERSAALHEAEDVLMEQGRLHPLLLTTMTSGCRARRSPVSGILLMVTGTSCMVTSQSNLRI